MVFKNTILYQFLDLQEDILKNPNAYKLLSEFRSETK